MRIQVMPRVVSVALLLCLTGCHALRGEHGVRHLSAFRMVRLGGTTSAPKNRHLLVRFLEVSGDAKSGRFEVQCEGQRYEGWAAEGESLGSFAKPLVGDSGVILTKLTPVEATLQFQWAESF
jgi:hypothetical protein